LAAVVVPLVTALPAAIAAATTLVGNVAGALTPKNTVLSMSRAAASSHSGWTCVPDRRAGVVEHVLGDRDDDGELLDVEELVGPVDLGGLLEAGVAGHPVCDRQRREHREADLAAGDGDAAKQLARRAALRLVGEVGEHVVAHLLGHQRACVGAGDDVVGRHGGVVLLDGSGRRAACRQGEARGQVRPAAARIAASMSVGGGV
jgi:hypothetical protein